MITIVRPATLRRSEDDPPPLARAKPSLTYLPAERVLAILAKVQQVLGQKILAHLAGRHRIHVAEGGTYHATQVLARSELGHFEETIAGYLDVRTSEPIAYGRTIVQFVHTPPIRMAPRFRDIRVPPLFKLLGPDIDKAEEQLTQQDFTAAGPSFIDLDLFAQAMAWRRVVRLALVVSLFRALDYQRMWKELDGDAGWWLSSRAESLAAFIMRSTAFRHFVRDVAEADTFLEEMGLRPMIHGILSLANVAKEAAEWRSWCERKGCTVDEIGNYHPWTFQPIDPSLHTLPGAQPLVAAPHMHARRSAEARAIQVRMMWNEVREKLLAQGAISDPNWFRFVVVAGSLRHGGAHPPHKTHRDGSMFDMDLTFLPDVAGPLAAADGPVAALSSPPQQRPEDDVDPATEEEVDIPQAPVGFEMPQAAPLRRADTVLIAKRSEWNLVAERFTQCVLLTLPGSIIFAAAGILDRARTQLLERLDPVIRDAAEGNEPSRLTELEILRRLIANARFILKPDHAGHWHVNYNPHALGDESDLVRTGQPKVAEDVAMALVALERDGFWRDLLGL